tara:strand:+ start:1432 stop:2289 length:858 start_codon:yes stop_codon:yes gene_type:complete
MTNYIQQNHVRMRFDKCVELFNEHDFFHKYCRKNLFDRLAPIKICPKIILNIGSATGSGSNILSRNYKDSQVYNIDLSFGMLKKSHLKENKRIKHIQAEASALPFNDNSIDLIFSNLCMPWLNDLPFFFKEIKRVMKKNGLFIFSTLGPDSLLALKKAWAEVDNFSHINNYIDMHIIGDQLLNVGLSDPVLDSERMIIKYNDISSLERDLTHTGARNALTARENSLTGRKKYEKFSKKLFPCNSSEKLNIEMEIIYGHAWGREPTPSQNEHVIDASNIMRRKINP